MGSVGSGSVAGGSAGSVTCGGGSVGAGSEGSGSVGAGIVGGRSEGIGSVGAGSVEIVSVGAGTVGIVSVGGGSVGKGSEGVGSVTSEATGAVATVAGGSVSNGMLSNALLSVDPAGGSTTLHAVISISVSKISAAAKKIRNFPFQQGIRVVIYTNTSFLLKRNNTATKESNGSCRTSVALRAELKGIDQPLTEPSIRPLLKYFCRKGYSTKTGNAATTTTAYLIMSKIWLKYSRASLS